MSSTADVSSPWGQRFVRPFLGAFAVILFALLGHQLAQQPDATILSGSSRAPLLGAGAVPPAAAEANPAFAVPPLAAEASEATLADVATHDENRHEPWSELGSICLLLAVVLLLVTVTTPRRVLLHWWLPRSFRVAPPLLLPVGIPVLPRVALSVSRT